MKYLFVLLRKLDFSKCRRWVFVILVYFLSIIYYTVDNIWDEHPIFTTVAIIFSILATIYSIIGLYICLIEDPKNKRKIDIYKNSERLKREYKEYRESLR